MMSNDTYLFPFQLCLGGLASCFEDVTEEMPEGPFDIILSRYAVAQFNWIQLAHWCFTHLRRWRTCSLRCHRRPQWLIDSLGFNGNGEATIQFLTE